MKLKSNWLILVGVAVLAGLFLIFGLNRKVQAQHFTAKVERGDIHDVVDATGTINVVITVHHRETERGLQFSRSQGRHRCADRSRTVPGRAAASLGGCGQCQSKPCSRESQSGKAKAASQHTKPTTTGPHS